MTKNEQCPYVGIGAALDYACPIRKGVLNFDRVDRDSLVKFAGIDTDRIDKNLCSTENFVECPVYQKRIKETVSEYVDTVADGDEKMKELLSDALLKED